MKKSICLTIAYLFLVCTSDAQIVEMAWSELIEFKQGALKNKKSIDIVSLNQENVACIINSMDNSQADEIYSFSIEELKNNAAELSIFTKEIQQPDLIKASAYEEKVFQNLLYANGEVFFYDSITYRLINDGFASKMLEEFKDEDKYAKTTDKKGNTVYKSNNKGAKTKITMTDEMLKMLAESKDTDAPQETEETRKQYQNESLSESLGVSKEYLNMTTIIKPIDQAEAKLSCDVSTYLHHDFDNKSYEHLVVNSLDVYYNEMFVVGIPKFVSGRALLPNSMHLNTEDGQIYIVHNNTFVDKEGINKVIEHALLTIVDLDGKYTNFFIDDSEKEKTQSVAANSIHPISKNEMIVLEQRHESFRMGYIKIY
ncbi:MAG: hypothetical protein ACI89M_002327 [Chitinophagales bacterium]|jgi:hypothetical protein